MTTKREAEVAGEKKVKMLLKKSKKDQFLDLWPKKMFNISKTCRAINIARDTLYLWAREDESFKQAMQEKYDEISDMAEDTLFKKIKAGDTICTLFYLKCKAKSRGYIETQRIEQATIGQVNHNHTIAYDYDRLSRSELESLRELLQKATTEDGES